MSVVNPLWTAAIRRHALLLTAAGVFLVFTLVHLAIFRPAVTRYETILRQTTEMGVSIEGGHSPQMVPPRVSDMLEANALPPSAAKERAESGALSASLLESTSRIAAAQNLDVIVTEPGSITQLANSVRVRAHVRLTGRFDRFLAFLRALDTANQLYTMDRFNIVPASEREQTFDLWLSQTFLIREGS